VSRTSSIPVIVPRVYATSLLLTVRSTTQVRYFRPRISALLHAIYAGDLDTTGPHDHNASTVIYKSSRESAVRIRSDMLSSTVFKNESHEAQTAQWTEPERSFRIFHGIQLLEYVAFHRRLLARPVFPCYNVGFPVDVVRSLRSLAMLTGNQGQRLSNQEVSAITRASSVPVHWPRSQCRRRMVNQAGTSSDIMCRRIQLALLSRIRQDAQQHASWVR